MLGFQALYFILCNIRVCASWPVNPLGHGLMEIGIF